MTRQFKNLVELMERSCARFSSRQLFGTRQEQRWVWTSYAEFKEQVDGFRGGLADLEVGAGDRVAIVSNNRVEWAVAAYGAYGLQATVVPMYQAQSPQERRFILEDCGAKVAVAETDELYRELAELQGELPQLRSVIGMSLPVEHELSFAARVEVGQRGPVPSQRPDGSTVAGLIYTSGTTGNPKGVVLSHENIASNIDAVHEFFVLEPDDRSLSFLPWAHSFGQVGELHMLLSMGCSIAINDRVPHLLENLQAIQPTVLFAVPRVLNGVYESVHKEMSGRPAWLQRLFFAGARSAGRRSRGEPVGVVGRMGIAVDDRLLFAKVRKRLGGRLRYVISAGAALDPEVGAFLDGLGIPIYEGYGLTETGPVVSVNYPGHRKLGTVGPPIPGVRVEIDETAGEQPPGRGEIVVYGPNVMQGYHNLPEENDKVFTRDGGFRTGDAGYLDEGGYLHVTGRIKEQYKLETGRYVMPGPVEGQLALSPYIAHVMLYGEYKPYNVALVVPDRQAIAQWAAQRGIQFADLTRDDRVQELVREELRERSSELRGFEKPRKFLLVDDEPSVENGMLTPTLKLKRRVVLDKYGERLDALYRTEPSERQPEPVAA